MLAIVSKVNSPTLTGAVRSRFSKAAEEKTFSFCIVASPQELLGQICRIHATSVTALF